MLNVISSARICVRLCVSVRECAWVCASALVRDNKIFTCCVLLSFKVTKRNSLQTCSIATRGKIVAMHIGP